MSMRILKSTNYGRDPPLTKQQRIKIVGRRARLKPEHEHRPRGWPFLVYSEIVMQLSPKTVDARLLLTTYIAVGTEVTLK